MQCCNVQYIFVVAFKKPNFGEVAVDMLTFAVVLLSLNQVIVFCVITTKLSNVTNRLIDNI